MRLWVRFKRFKNPEIDYAAPSLCQDLNIMDPMTLDRFHLPILFEVDWVIGKKFSKCCCERDRLIGHLKIVSIVKNGYTYINPNK